MYERLCEGKTLRKKEEAVRFNVDVRSIQRDIDDIRAFLSERSRSGSADQRELVFDRSKEGYVLTGCEGSLMSNDEILAVSKILLASRAFTKRELKSILDKMIAGCVPVRNMKLVSDLVSNERYHYVELKHKSAVKDKLWALGEEIKQHELLEITYRKQLPSREKVKRIIEPVAIIFSEYYFYLNAYIVEENEAGEYVQKYDYPAVFRVDRIEKYKKTGKTFRINYMDRFEEGEFRKRVQFMFPGTLMRLQFKYSGKSPEAILDRLPTASVIKEEKDGLVIEAEVYGKGILMWLLSQGSSIEVLRPQSVREEMKKMLQEMLAKY